MSALLTRERLLFIAATFVAAVVGIGVGHVFWATTKQLSEAAPDTPPGEYLYLDSDRVLAYLGQIEGGLSPTEKTIESTKAAQSGALKSGLLGDIAASKERQRTRERVVTPVAADRFFTLLIKLRAGRERRNGRTLPWLHDLDAGITKKNTVETVRKRLFRLREGDFVRISNAHLFLPPYAAIVPKARYAASYLGGRIQQPLRPLYAPISQRLRNDLNAYLELLGNDPSLPFVLPTLSANRSDRQAVTFFVPGRYTSLVDNARLLAGNLIVVGKVVYKDPRLPGGASCRRRTPVTRVPCSYFDRQTVATFAPALERAPRSVLAGLRLNRDEVLGKVHASVNFRVPVVVVLPIAIYQ